MQDVRLFVVRLGPPEVSEFDDHIEIQLLRSDGRAEAVAIAGFGCNSVKVGGIEVGRAVLDKAESLEEGRGIYVNLQGDEVNAY
ncbi:hypothetical protein [Botrimarina sp.]|uniref:hypothetical protein n=1 Tax=Botrimarina sp. TaxID=2795802 RepID=UPI0032EBDBA8